MSEGGQIPAPTPAPGALAYQKLLSGGFSAQEANDWRAKQSAQLASGGFTQDDIDKYWGDKQPNTAQLDGMNRGNAAIHQATNPLETLEAGWQMSVSGLAIRGKTHDVVAPEHAGLLSKMLEATGQFVGDFPATVAGLIGGAGAGAVAGAAVPGAGETGIGEAVGGLAGAGFGSNALPEAMRQVMLDAYNRGEIHTFKDFAAMATKSTWETAKAGVTGAAASLVGGKVGGTVLAATAKPWLATGANMTSQALTATTVGAGLEGRVPDADSFVVGASIMLGFHAAGRVVGAAGGQRVVPSEAGRRVAANLQTIYRQTGIPPWEAVKKAQTDPAFKSEVMAQDVNGDAVIPNFKASAPDEPPKPGQKSETEATGNPVEDLLPKVRALEGSGDQAISPAGAIGRYQIMPGTARQYGFDPEKLTDPAYNENAARTILSDLYRRFRGDEDVILTAYNAGPGRAAKLLTAGPGTRLEATDGKHGWEYERVAADRSEAGLPLETQEYLARGRASGGGGGKEPPGGGGATPPEGEQPNNPAPGSTDERVANFLSRVGEPSTKHRTILNDLEMELDAARRLDKRVIEQGLIDPKKDLTVEDMARQTYGSETRFNHFAYKGPVDPVTFEAKDGVSLKDIADEIKGVGGNKDEFNTYRVSLRTIEKAKQGIEAGVIPLEEAKANAADPNLQKYAKANDMMQAWKKSVLEYVRDSGGISQNQMDAMEKLNTSHVSLRRVMGDDAAFQTGGKSMRAASPIRRMEGSDRKIIDPWLADMDNARMMIRFADRNRAAGHVVGLGEAAGLTKVKATLAEPGSDEFKAYDLSDKEMAALKPFFQAASGKSEGTRFTYYRNGKPEVYEAQDENLAGLYRVAQTPGEMGLVGKIGSLPAKIARAGIAAEPSFGPRVMLKHQLTAFVLDPAHPPPFITMLRGMMDVINKGDAFWDLARNGGLSGSITDLDKNFFEQDAQKILDQTGALKRAWNAVSHPIELSMMITDRLAMASRIGYFKRAVGQGIEPAKAAMMARRAYLDYDERFVGQLAQTWSKFVPFFKADVLGMKQGWEAIQPNRLPKTLMYVAAGMVLPQVALYALNRKADETLPDGKKYTDLPQWERDNYFITPPIAGQRFRLGRPYNIGPLFGVPTERFLEFAFENDPHAFDGMLKSMLSPAPLAIPAAVSPIIEDKANYSFFSGQPLVPDSLKDASPDMQYTSATTEPAKKIARILGPHGANIADLSPIVIDNYAQAWTGTLGADVMRALGGSFTTGGKPWELSDLPFVHSFIIRNPKESAQPIQDFYTDLGKLREAQRNVQLGKDRMDFSVVEQDAASAQLYSRMATISQAIGKMRAAVQNINDNTTMTTDEKRQNTDRIYGDMVGFAKAGEKAMQGFSK